MILVFIFVFEHFIYNIVACILSAVEEHCGMYSQCSGSKTNHFKTSTIFLINLKSNNFTQIRNSIKFCLVIRSFEAFSQMSYY